MRLQRQKFFTSRNPRVSCHDSKEKLTGTFPYRPHAWEAFRGNNIIQPLSVLTVKDSAIKEQFKFIWSIDGGGIPSRVLPNLFSRATWRHLAGFPLRLINSNGMFFNFFLEMNGSVTRPRINHQPFDWLVASQWVIYNKPIGYTQ